METILGLIRHILTFAGGYAVTEGWVAQDDVTTGVGAIVTIIGIVWSALSKSDKFPAIK